MTYRSMEVFKQRFPSFDPLFLAWDVCKQVIYTLNKVNIRIHCTLYTEKLAWVFKRGFFFLYLKNNFFVTQFPTL